MINISAIVSKWLIVNNHLSCSFCKVNFGFSTLSFSIAIVSIWYLIGLFHFLQSILRLFKGEEFELDFRIDCSIRYVVFVYSFPILIEYSKIVQVCMAIKVHWHLIKTELHRDWRWQFNELALFKFDTTNIFFFIMVWIKNFLDIQVSPN